MDAATGGSHDGWALARKSEAKASKVIKGSVGAKEGAALFVGDDVRAGRLRESTQPSKSSPAVVGHVFPQALAHLTNSSQTSGSQTILNFLDQSLQKRKELRSIEGRKPRTTQPAQQPQQTGPSTPSNINIHRRRSQKAGSSMEKLARDGQHTQPILTPETKERANAGEPQKQGGPP